MGHLVRVLGVLVNSSLRLRAWGLLAAILVLLGWQALAPAPVVMMALAMVAGLLIGSLGWVLVLRRGIHLERTMGRERMQVGEVFAEGFALGNRSGLLVPWAEVRDASTLPAYQASHALAVGARGVGHWGTKHTCLQRGVYTLGPATIRLGDPFGLWELVLAHPETRTLLIYPALVPLPPIVRARCMLPGAARPERFALGATVNVTGVRPYSPGDPFNRIHWRSTAHRSTSEREQFSIKEFDPEPLSDVWLFLDLQACVQAGQGLDSTEEYAVALAASLAHQMLRQQRGVGLAAYGAQPVFIPPQRGESQLWRLLGALAEARAMGHMPLAQVLELAEPHIRRGMSCLVITPSGEPAWPEALMRLLGRGIRPTALLLDAPSFGGPGGQQEVAARLTGLGVDSLILGRELALYPRREADSPSPVAARPVQEEVRPWAAA